MTQEDKNLLLKDLCARSPYGVKCQFIWTYNNETTDGEDVIANDDDNIRCIDFHTKEILSDYCGEWVDLEHCKPYLRPMSNMTEVEESVLSLCDAFIEPRSIELKIDFYNRRHFDYRGLIEKGLALPAPEGMYKNLKL